MNTYEIGEMVYIKDDDGLIVQGEIVKIFYEDLTVWVAYKDDDQVRYTIATFEELERYLDIMLETASWE